MTEVPGIFLSAAAWAAGRPFGDAAGMAVRELLDGLTGPPRIGVCTVDAPVSITIAHATMVQTSWPAVGSGTDVVILLHAGEIPGRVRSRMRRGPQAFVHMEDKEQAEKYTIAPAELAEIRADLLGCELRALAIRFPEVAALIRRDRPSGPGALRVVVIGPDAVRVAVLREKLAPHVTVVDSADADVVVAVPGERGFTLVDAPTIQDAWQRVGRLVTLSPLPSGVCPRAVPAGRDLVDTVHRLGLQPAASSVPPVPAGRWAQALDRIDGRERDALRGLRARGDRAGMRAFASDRGVALPPDPTIPLRELLIAAGLILVLCVSRPDLLPVVLGIVGVRTVQQRNRALGRWWEEASISVSLDITSTVARRGVGPRGWLWEMLRDGEKTI